MRFNGRDGWVRTVGEQAFDHWGATVGVLWTWWGRHIDRPCLPCCDVIINMASSCNLIQKSQTGFTTASSPSLTEGSATIIRSGNNNENIIDNTCDPSCHPTVVMRLLFFIHHIPAINCTVKPLTTALLLLNEDRGYYSQSSFGLVMCSLIAKNRAACACCELVVVRAANSRRVDTIFRCNFSGIMLSKFCPPHDAFIREGLKI